MTPPFLHRADSNKKLLFACYHFYLDPSNGASITAREMLLALAKRGWEVTTFCGCGLDFQKPEAVRQFLADRRIPIVRQFDNTAREQGNPQPALPFSLAFFHDGLLKSSVFLPVENLHIPSQEAGTVFLDLLREQILQTKPHILVTYGGYWLSGHLLQISRDAGLKNVMLLQNLEYKDASYFKDFDLILVPSQFASDHYNEKLSLKTTPIAPMMDWNGLPRS